MKENWEEIKKKDDKLYVKWKGYDNSLTVGLLKKIQLRKISLFPELYNWSKSKIKVKLDFSNYATKSDLKKGAGVDKSGFVKKV